MISMRPTRLFILMGFVLSVSACAAGRTDLTESGAVEVELEEGPQARIEGISVFEGKGETILYGRVRRLGVYNNAFVGKQVTARAVFPNGFVQERTDTLLTVTPRPRSFRQVYPVAKFKIVFPKQFPPGTTLVVDFGHRSKGEG